MSCFLTCAPEEFCKGISSPKELPEYFFWVSECEMAKARVEAAKVEVVASIPGQSLLTKAIINISLLL